MGARSAQRLASSDSMRAASADTTTCCEASRGGLANGGQPGCASPKSGCVSPKSAPAPASSLAGRLALVGPAGSRATVLEAA
eukprot:3988714-Pyramimonas_sp.AAC.1